MTNIITKSTITDAEILDVLDNVKDDSILSDTGTQIVSIVREYQKIGPIVCSILENKTLGVGGIGRIHSGFGIAWIIINKVFLQYPKYMLSICRKIIKEGSYHLGLHRVQMDIDIAHEENIRFAKKLGFEFEGRMRKFGPQMQDYDRYVLFPGQ